MVFLVMFRTATYYVIYGFLFALLAGCSSVGTTSTDQNSKPLSASAGTLNYSDRIGTSFMFIFNLDEQTSGEGIEVQVFGPRGWNGGEPVRRVFPYSEAGKHVTWANIFRDADGNRMEAISGPYIVQASIAGQNQRVETAIDTNSILPKPQNLTLLQATASKVSLDWDKVPGAQSYLVELFETETGSLDEDAFVYVTDTNASLEELSLAVGGEYRIGVTAFVSNFTQRESQSLPRGQFNASFISQRFTASAD